MFPIHPLQTTAVPEPGIVNSAGVPSVPPFWGEEGAYFGHEWACWRYDTLDEQTDRLLVGMRKPAIRVLDVGCATGARAAAFALAGYQVTAVDILNRAQAIEARSVGLRRADPASHPIRFVQGDLRALDRIGLARGFDLIHLRRVLTFVRPDDLLAVFAALATLIGANGCLVASFVSLDVHAEQMRTVADPGSRPPVLQQAGMVAHHFSEVHGALRANGFQITDGFSDGVIDVGLIARNTTEPGSD